jgi:hypothetical protein
MLQHDFLAQPWLGRHVACDEKIQGNLFVAYPFGKFGNFVTRKLSNSLTF